MVKARKTKKKTRYHVVASAPHGTYAFNLFTSSKKVADYWKKHGKRLTGWNLIVKKVKKYG